jgi:hypothetical protein
MVYSSHTLRAAARPAAPEERSAVPVVALFGMVLNQWLPAVLFARVVYVLLLIMGLLLIVL